MLFERYLMPDLMTDHFYNVKPDMLVQAGIRGVICDIDNTLATYEEPDPPENVRLWCAGMQAAGIRIAFVSNNDAARVNRFNKDFGFPAFPDAKKPFGDALRRAMEKMGTDVTSTAMLGDQLLTDALAAKREGMMAIIVPPIKDKRTLFFRFKRWLERPYVNMYRRRHSFLE